MEASLWPRMMPRERTRRLEPHPGVDRLRLSAAIQLEVEHADGEKAGRWILVDEDGKREVVMFANDEPTGKRPNVGRRIKFNKPQEE